METRQSIIHLVSEACQQGASQAKACKALEVSERTLQRWKTSPDQLDKRVNPTHTPSNKLSEFERERVVRVCNLPEYADLPPCKIVPKLADKGEYIASESTIYRILKEESQLAHRLKSKPKREIKKPDALVATAGNQVYSWDITYLPTATKGVFYYLYLVMDVYSRKIVGWQIYEQENSEFAADLMIDICQREGIAKDQVVLHSDNGSPMKGATMLSTLQSLGIMPSFSRPSVSNDNPYSESLFRTLKYRPEYPEKPFETLNAARQWVEGFVQWYNYEHMHSSIKFVTPVQRHTGEDKAILKRRKAVYVQAKKRHPERWRGDTRNWSHEGEVYLNPSDETKQMKDNRAA